MFESVLFRHDLRSSLAAQSRMFIGGVTYFALAIPPILILAIPSLIILAQLNLRYGARALNPGERAMLTVEVANEDLLFEAHAKASGDISITPPIRDLDNLQVSWRVDPKPAATDSNSQQAKVILSIGEASTEQPIHVGTRPETLPTEVHVSPLWQFLYPGGSVPETLRSYVRSIVVTYPEQTMHMAGMNMDWLVLFVCLSILSGFAASKVFGIEI